MFRYRRGDFNKKVIKCIKNFYRPNDKIDFTTTEGVKQLKEDAISIGKVNLVNMHTIVVCCLAGCLLIYIQIVITKRRITESDEHVVQRKIKRYFSEEPTNANAADADEENLADYSE